jgi:hypothetical protein
LIPSRDASRYGEENQNAKMISMTDVNRATLFDVQQKNCVQFKGGGTWARSEKKERIFLILIFELMIQKKKFSQN